jgi:hypothetical protein
MLNAAQVKGMCVSDRGQAIINQANINSSDDGLERSRKISSVINTFIQDYIQLTINDDLRQPFGSVLVQPNTENSICSAINQFKPNAYQTIADSKPTVAQCTQNSANIYELAGANTLASSNRITRNLSTVMGLLWESIASISPYALNPESEFNIKISGIDLIVRNIDTNLIEYIQLKTQKNTLTGSQAPRCRSELSIHANPVFAVCFLTSSQWTFNSPIIPRVCGSDFWSRIGIDYSLFERLAKNLIHHLDQRYINT